jgi:hypothetical protein
VLVALEQPVDHVHDLNTTSGEDHRSTIYSRHR